MTSDRGGEDRPNAEKRDDHDRSRGGSRVDRIARAVAVAPRRRILAALLGAALGVGGARADAVVAADCPRRQRCGGGCCRDCFVKRDGDTGKRTGVFCCSKNKICRSPEGRSQDQCCYADEVCRDGACCRRCGDVCCESYQRCDNGSCVDLNTARLARIRR